MEIKEQIIESICNSLNSNNGDRKTYVVIEEIQIGIPENSEFGDYSTNIAMQAWGTVQGNIAGIKLHKHASNISGKNPREMAENIRGLLLSDIDLAEIVDRIEVAGPGFINFYLSQKALSDNLNDIIKDKEGFGTSGLGEGKTVIIDYSAPNIAKRFSIGHLRSTIIGQALYNIYKKLGFEVIGDNHLGDWGTQFGKLLYMIEKEAVQEFDIDKLEELYVRFHEEATNPEVGEEMENGAREWFKRLEDGDSKAREIWQKCKDVSLAEFNEIYKRLGIEIDYAYGESFYEERMKKLLDDAKVKNHLKAMEGGTQGWIIDLNDSGLKTPLMFLKSDGATTYATRDLATIDYRVEKWKPDFIIYEVGAEQTLHFQQVFAAARKIGIVDEKTVFYHTKHGLYLSPDGKKFRTRAGGTVKLQEVLDEAVDMAKKIITKSETSRDIDSKQVDPLAERIGIGAIKYFDLMHSPQSDIVFDWDKVVNMDGNSGPYIQYTYARTQSVLKKATDVPADIKTADLNKDEEKIMRQLIHLPQVIEDAALNYSPNIICNYLYKLAQGYNSFYNGNKIIGGENEGVRLALTSAVGTVIKNGLDLLGIQAPERM